MPTATTTPTPAPGTPTPGIIDSAKMWGVWMVLAGAAYGMAMSRLNVPPFLQPFLTVLWILPIVAAVYVEWPHFGRTAAFILIGVWLISSMLISIPRASMQWETSNKKWEDYLIKKDPRSFDSYQKEKLDFWLKFSGHITPQMLAARTDLFDQTQSAQDAYATQLNDELVALKTQLDSKKITPEKHSEESAKIAERISLLEANGHKLMRTVKSYSSTGMFGLPFWLWTVILGGLTWYAKSIPQNHWGQLAMIVCGGLLTLMYLGETWGSLTQVAGSTNSFSIGGFFNQLPGGAMFALIVAILATVGFITGKGSDAH